MKQAQQNAAVGVGFTRGPWKITFSGSSAIIQDEMDCTVAECPSYGVGFTRGNQPAPWHLFKDNARLIASAPDLLSALELAKATIERLHRHALGSANGTLDVINSAIAKATANR